MLCENICILTRLPGVVPQPLSLHLIVVSCIILKTFEKIEKIEKIEVVFLSEKKLRSSSIL
jgi:hypothetical protein